MDLNEIRQEIDEIDRKIVELYEKRMDASKRVAEFKIETGKKVFDKQREDEKIRKVKALTSNDFNSSALLVNVKRPSLKIPSTSKTNKRI